MMESKTISRREGEIEVEIEVEPKVEWKGEGSRRRETQRNGREEKGKGI
jgi:hypothetical protein